MTTSPFRGRKPARMPKPKAKLGQEGHLGLQPLVPPALPENAVRVDPAQFRPSVTVEEVSDALPPDQTSSGQSWASDAFVQDRSLYQQEGIPNADREQDEAQYQDRPEPDWDDQLYDADSQSLDASYSVEDASAQAIEESEVYALPVQPDDPADDFVEGQFVERHETEQVATGTRRSFLRRQEAEPQREGAEKKSGFLGLRRRRQEGTPAPEVPDSSLPSDEAGLLVDTAALARSAYLEQNQGPVFAAPEVNQAISLEPGEGRLVASGIAKSFGKRRILKDMGLGVAQGEVVGLLGPNGAGKTTSFYIVCGLLKPDAGQVSINGTKATNLPVYRRARLGLGYLPQEASIFRGMNVEQNILSVLETRYFSTRKRWERLNALLDDFSIQHIRKSPALALSGGERRRVEIARALAADPTFILLDEPFAGVDPIAVGDIRNLVSQLKNRGIGVLITDHNVRDTLSVVDRAYIIFDGQVLKQGTPAEIVADERVRQVYLGEQFSL